MSGEKKGEITREMLEKLKSRYRKEALLAVEEAELRGYERGKKEGEEAAEASAAINIPKADTVASAQQQWDAPLGVIGLQEDGSFIPSIFVKHIMEHIYRDMKKEFNNNSEALPKLKNVLIASTSKLQEKLPQQVLPVRSLAQQGAAVATGAGAVVSADQVPNVGLDSGARKRTSSKDVSTFIDKEFVTKLQQHEQEQQLQKQEQEHIAIFPGRSSPASMALIRVQPCIYQLHNLSQRPALFVRVLVPNTIQNVKKGIIMDSGFVSYKIEVEVVCIVLVSQAAGTFSTSSGGGSSMVNRKTSNKGLLGDSYVRVGSSSSSAHHSSSAQWRYSAERRHSEFKALCRQLMREFPLDMIPPLPSKYVPLSIYSSSSSSSALSAISGSIIGDAGGAGSGAGSGSGEGGAEEQKIEQRRRMLQLWLQYICGIGKMQHSPLVAQFVSNSSSLTAGVISATRVGVAASDSSRASTDEARPAAGEEPAGMLIGAGDDNNASVDRESMVSPAPEPLNKTLNSVAISDTTGGKSVEKMKANTNSNKSKSSNSSYMRGFNDLHAFTKYFSGALSPSDFADRSIGSGGRVGLKARAGMRGRTGASVDNYNTADSAATIAGGGGGDVAAGGVSKNESRERGKDYAGMRSDLLMRNSYMDKRVCYQDLMTIHRDINQLIPAIQQAMQSAEAVQAALAHIGTSVYFPLASNIREWSKTETGDSYEHQALSRFSSALFTAAPFYARLSEHFQRELLQQMEFLETTCVASCQIQVEKTIKSFPVASMNNTIVLPSQQWHFENANANFNQKQRNQQEKIQKTVPRVSNSSRGRSNSAAEDSEEEGYGYEDVYGSREEALQGDQKGALSAGPDSPIPAPSTPDYDTSTAAAAASAAAVAPVSSGRRPTGTRAFVKSVLPSFFSSSSSSSFSSPSTATSTATPTASATSSPSAPPSANPAPTSSPAPLPPDSGSGRASGARDRGSNSSSSGGGGGEGTSGQDNSFSPTSPPPLPLPPVLSQQEVQERECVRKAKVVVQSWDASKRMRGVLLLQQVYAAVQAVAGTYGELAQEWETVQTDLSTLSDLSSPHSHLFPQSLTHTHTHIHRHSHLGSSAAATAATAAGVAGRRKGWGGDFRVHARTSGIFTGLKNTRARGQITRKNDKDKRKDSNEEGKEVDAAVRRRMRGESEEVDEGEENEEVKEGEAQREEEQEEEEIDGVTDGLFSAMKKELSTFEENLNYIKTTYETNRRMQDIFLKLSSAMHAHGDGDDSAAIHEEEDENEEGEGEDECDEGTLFGRKDRNSQNNSKTKSKDGGGILSGRDPFKQIKALISRATLPAGVRRNPSRPASHRQFATGSSSTGSGAGARTNAVQHQQQQQQHQQQHKRRTSSSVGTAAAHDGRGRKKGDKETHQKNKDSDSDSENNDNNSNNENSDSESDGGADESTGGNGRGNGTGARVRGGGKGTKGPIEAQESAEISAATEYYDTENYIKQHFPDQAAASAAVSASYKKRGDGGAPEEYNRYHHHQQLNHQQQQQRGHTRPAPMRAAARNAQQQQQQQQQQGVGGSSGSSGGAGTGTGSVFGAAPAPAQSLAGRHAAAEDRTPAPTTPSHLHSKPPTYPHIPATGTHTGADATTTTGGGAARMVSPSRRPPSEPQTTAQREQQQQQQQQQRQQKQLYTPGVPGADGLPEGWEKVVAEDGSSYYYHNVTRISRWDRPTEAVAAAHAARVSKAQAEVQDAVERRKREFEREKKLQEERALLADQLQSSVRRQIESWKTGSVTALTSTTTITSTSSSGRVRGVAELLGTLHTILRGYLPEDGVVAAGKAPLNDQSPPNEVKRAYLKAVKFIHPDKLPEDLDQEKKMIAEAAFVVISEAYNSFRAKLADENW